MEYRTLGSSGLKVSELCLGAMTFGEADDEVVHARGRRATRRPSYAIMNRALERGRQLHRHRRRLRPGRPLASASSALDGASARRRDRVVLATKFRFRMGEGPNATRRVALPHRARRRGQPARG